MGGNFWEALFLRDWKAVTPEKNSIFFYVILVKWIIGLKGILEFRFGKNLGLRLEAKTKLNNKSWTSREFTLTYLTATFT